MSDPVRLVDPPPATAGVASGRLARIVLAYVLAIAAATLLRTFGLVVEESLTTGFDRMIDRNGWASLLVVPALGALVALLAAAPFATAFFVVAEAMGLAGRAMWIAAGATIAVLTQTLVTVPFGLGSSSLALLGLDAVVGAVGGGLAWIVAVRAAPPPPAARTWADV